MHPMENKHRALWALIAGIVCGAAVWGFSIPVTGMREPFDSPSNYYILAMFLAGVIATIPAPRYWWLAVVGIFVGERLYALVMLPETRAWLLFGVFVNLLILSWLPAALGAFVVYIGNRQLTKRSSGRS